jgi:hypothetical protein
VVAARLRRVSKPGYEGAMKKDESDRMHDPRAERERRLAEALRANLKRRKTAARTGKLPDTEGRTAEKGGSSGNDEEGRG